MTLRHGRELEEQGAISGQLRAAPDDSSRGYEASLYCCFRFLSMFSAFFHDLARSIVILFYVLPVCLVNDGNENGGQDFEWISDKYDS